MYSQKFLIPASATTGTTWMRVQMKRNGFPTSCEVIPFGEVEEYSIEILPNINDGGTSNARGFYVYPNPFTDVFTLEFEGNNASPTQVSIIDLSGKVLYTSTIEAQKGINRYQLDNTANLSDGVYIIKVVGQDISETHKIIKTSRR